MNWSSGNVHIVHYNLTTTTKEGGVETFVWDLARQQAQNGQRVTIVSGVGAVRRSMAGVAVRMTPYLDRRRLAFGPLRRAYALRKLAERLSMLPLALPLLRDADLVHIHKPYDLPLAPLLRRRGIPLVYHGHGEDFFPGDRWWMGFAATLISCSSSNARSLHQHYARNATVVYNGVDTLHFQPQAAHAELRARLQGDGRWVVLLPGRIMPWKGHEHALTALALLNDPGVRLVVIGDGDSRVLLEQQAMTLGIQDQVQFLGTIPHRELPGYVAAADLVLGASYASETFGMVLAEAMACARPVLASSWHGYDDVVLQDQTGARFRAADPADLAQMMAMLLADERRRTALGRAGRAHVLAHFTWAQVAARVQAVYETVLR